MPTTVVSVSMHPHPSSGLAVKKASTEVKITESSASNALLSVDATSSARSEGVLC